MCRFCPKENRTATIENRRKTSERSFKNRAVRGGDGRRAGDPENRGKGRSGLRIVSKRFAMLTFLILLCVPCVCVLYAVFFFVPGFKIPASHDRLQGAKRPNDDFQHTVSADRRGRLGGRGDRKGDLLTESPAFVFRVDRNGRFRQAEADVAAAKAGDVRGDLYFVFRDGDGKRVFRYHFLRIPRSLSRVGR